MSLDSVRKRLRAYFCLGGTWNPEAMEHQKVADLLRDCEHELDQAAGVLRSWVNCSMDCAACRNNATRILDGGEAIGPEPMLSRGGRMQQMLIALDRRGGLGVDTHRQVRAAIGVPYPEFCRHSDVCAGKSSCPRDPVCCD
jgi:hypothetical protein